MIKKVKLISLLTLLLLVGISSNCFSQPPASWTVNPASYTNSVTVTCDMNYLCNDLADTNNVIAAFINGSCRGVAKTNIVISPSGNKIATLTVYSNTPIGEYVTFKGYVDSINTVYNAIDSIYFKADSIYGQLTSPFEVTDNHTPTNILLSSYSISEGAFIGDTVGLFSVVDNDTTSTLSYTLPGGFWDNNKYITNGEALELNTILNYSLDPIDTIFVSVTDTGGCSFQKQIIINILDSVYKPIAVNDTLTFNEDNDTTLYPLTNDIDLDYDIDSTSVLIIIGTQNGIATVDSTGKVSYSPNQDYFGTDSLTYSVCDMTTPTPLCDTAFIYFNVIAIPDAPVANADTFGVIEDSTFYLNVLLNDTDPENDIDSSSLSIIIPPNHGTANVVSNRIEYLPNLYYNGMDTLTYAICDATTPTPLCDTAILIIQVIPVPTPPIDIIIDTLFIKEDNSYPIRISYMHSVDNDPIEAFTYDLVPGTGDDDNSQFTIVDSSLILNTKTNYDVKTSYNFRVRSTDLYGLTFEKEFVLQVIDIPGNQIPLPSANYISPNGDGKNDFWVVENVEIYKEFELFILDQYGQVLYNKTNNYQNEWDGKYNGEALPTGNYYYIFRNDNLLYKGNITLINNN